MTERWGREQVLGLAPDAASGKAAAGVARPARWSGTGCDEVSVWGVCQGSGASGYRACVDLTEPAFRCSCPSRKFPCKHALGLLLLWSDGAVPGASARAGWVEEWLTERRQRAEKAEQRKAATATRTPDPRTAERREQRVDDGVADLDQWLGDQIAQGLVQAEKAPYRVWDDAARRLIDAQAPGLAGQVKALSSMRHGEAWPERMLEECALLRLLTSAHRRRAELPEPLRATVRSRIGFTVPQEEVERAGERVRDEWYIAGLRETAQDQITTRRIWLRGRRTGRPALLLAFAVPGRPFDGSLVAGSTVDAELAFYPGAQPLRALVIERHGTARSAPPEGTTVEGLLREYAGALAQDPWLDRWPAVLAAVRLGTPPAGPAGSSGGDRESLAAVDEHGHALPLRLADPVRDRWRLLAVSGGTPLALAGEWSPRGLRPMSAWHPEEGVVVL